ncbi:MAG: dethiobiotin synthase [Pseudomonadota bacterium]|nr:dethiobiotin synthase [Pseudomonadota bacterium]
MAKRFFITSTGTGIGKTFITAALVCEAGRQRRTVMAYKPVISGFDALHAAGSDTAILLRSLGLPRTDLAIERVSPWRYEAPLAPSMAARQENRPLVFDALAAWSRNALLGPEEIVMIEGVGGVLVPLNDTHTVLDWMRALSVPVLLVTGTALGAISHTLAALMVLEQRKLTVDRLIVNESEGATVTLDQTVDELRRWVKPPVTAVPRRSDAEGWTNVTELKDVLS